MEATRDVDNFLKILEILATLLLGFAGLYFANNYRRQVRLTVSERRLQAYAKLWAVTKTASPSRMKTWDPSSRSGSLSDEEREKIYFAFVWWYYTDGNGMLLGGSTRNLFLRAKDNLCCRILEFRPRLAREKLLTIARDTKLSKDERRKQINELRGELSISQLSLLRTQMKADLEVYGRHYFGDLDKYQKALLKELGFRLWKRPWGSPWQSLWLKRKKIIPE